MAFINIFLPLELREKKFVEFMNLCEGLMRGKEYYLKFTQLYKYAPTLVGNSKARMNKLMMGVSSLVKEECQTTMLNHYIYICRLIVYAQQIKETRLGR